MKNFHRKFATPNDFVRNITDNWSHYEKFTKPRQLAGDKFCWNGHEKDPESWLRSFGSFDEELVAKFDKEVEKYSDFFPNPMKHKFVTIPSVVGYRASVPDYLSGNPKAMRLKKKFKSNFEPIALWYSLELTAHAHERHIIAQAAMIYRVLSLIRNYRPVTFYMFCSEYPSPSVLIEVPPNISRAQFAKTTCIQFRRGARFAYLAGKEGKPEWKGAFGPLREFSKDLNVYRSKMREICNFKPRLEDVIIPEAQHDLIKFGDEMQEWLMNAVPEYRQYKKEKELFNVE